MHGWQREMGVGGGERRKGVEKGGRERDALLNQLSGVQNIVSVAW